MTWTAPGLARTKTLWAADERACLDSYLDHHRDTLLQKCSGLTGRQLTTRAVPTSALTLMGLVRHMAVVERSWFRERFDGQKDLEDIFGAAENKNGDFDLVDPAHAEADSAAYATEVAMTKAVVAGRS